MPQFDIFEFSRLYIWFLFIFIYFYIFWALYIIPQIFKSQMMRRFIVINNNISFIINKIIFLKSKYKIINSIVVFNYSFFKYLKNVI